MKTSVFDMNFVLPPLVEMAEVVKDTQTLSWVAFNSCLSAV